VYDLHTLGWNAFQQLCLTVTREILGQTVESFLDSNDGGRDGAFVGHWKTQDGECLSGAFVIQCKFTSKRDQALRISDITDELEKIRRLVDAGLCDTYVLMTNAGVSAERILEIRETLHEFGVRQARVFGSTWLFQQIQENKRLRMLVPRVYGLGDLSQILDERAYLQSAAILESLRDDLSKVVVTDAYRRAAEALDKHHFVLLIGEPAAGKTTIASMLAMAALDQWNASMLKLNEPSNVADRWNPEEPSQFFWVDDAFGVMQYEEHLVLGWNRILPQIKTMIRKGARIVMTSRDYIYNRARRDLKECTFPLLNESQVVIDVQALSIEERRQILYNHIKLGRQPRSFREEIKPYLEQVASHPRFIPEIARRLGEPLFTRGLFIDSYYLLRFVEQREQLLREVLHGLDADSKAALALIYMRSDRLESPVTLQAPEDGALARLNSTLGGCLTALEALQDSLVMYVHVDGESYWRFKHPTIGDAYAQILSQGAELLEIYIRGTSPERLVNQVTCGDVGIEKAVIVPRSLFPLMLLKLADLSSNSSYKSRWLAEWGASRALQDFLSSRCSREFLSLYLTERPEILDRIAKPGLFLSAAPEVRLAERLHELDLLPEDIRLRFVTTVAQYAIEGEDTSSLDDAGLRSVFTAAEFEDLRQRVRDELVPRLGDVTMDWESNYSSSEDAEEHMSQWLTHLTSLENCYSDDSSISERIDKERESVLQWIGEHTNASMTATERKFGSVETLDVPVSSRSIFDDIDADDSLI
jgi:hypothetical protein